MRTNIYKIKEVENQKTGELERKYYNEELNKFIDLPVVDDEPYVVYDEETKVQLKGEELEAYKESHIDEIEEIEDELDIQNEIEQEEEIEGVKKIQVVENKVNEEYSYIFGYSDVVSVTDMKNALKLDTTKEYTKQQVSDSSFKQGFQYIFDDLVYGHEKNTSIFSYGVGNAIKVVFDKINYDINVVGDSDSRAHAEKKESKGMTEEKYEQKREKLHEEIEDTANKIEQEHRDRIAKELEGQYEVDSEEYEYELEKRTKQAFDKTKFILESGRAVGRMSSSLVFTGRTGLKQFVDTTKYNEKLKDQTGVEPMNFDELYEQAKMAQLGIMSQLLGNGNPLNAYEQFLNKESLQEGKYEFDEKAIDTFVKKNLMTEKQLISFASKHLKTDDIQKAYQTLKNGEYKIPEAVSFEEAVREGKKILNDGNLHLDNEYALAYNEKKVCDASIEINDNLYKKAQVYNNLTTLRQTRSKAYAFFHPFKNRAEKRILNEIKNELTSKAVENTSFKDGIDKLLDPNSTTAQKLEALETMKENITEPLNDLDYIDANRDKVPVDKMLVGKSVSTEIFKDKQALLQIMAEYNKEMGFFSAIENTELKDYFKDRTTCGIDKRDVVALVMRKNGFIDNQEDFTRATIEILDKAKNNREEFLNEYYDDFDKYDHSKNGGYDYETTKDIFLRYQTNQLNSSMLQKNFGNNEYKENRYYKDVESQMLFSEKVAIDSKMGFEICRQIIEVTGINPNIMDNMVVEESGNDIYENEMNSDYKGFEDYCKGNDTHCKFTVPDYFLFQDQFNNPNGKVPQDYINKFIDLEKNVDVRESYSVIESLNGLVNNLNTRSGQIYNNTDCYDIQNIFVDGNSLYDMVMEQYEERHSSNPNLGRKALGQELLSIAVQQGKPIEVAQLFDEKGELHTRIIPVDFVSNNESFEKRFGKDAKGPYEDTYEKNEADMEKRHEKIAEYIGTTLLDRVNEANKTNLKRGIVLPQNREDVKDALEKHANSPKQKEVQPARQNIAERTDLFEKLQGNVNPEKKAPEEKVQNKEAEKVKEIEAPQESVEKN